MRAHYGRVAKGVSLVLAGGFLMAGIGTTCTSVAGTTALSGVDFCFIFDCQNALGGTFDPCAPADVRMGDETLENRTLLMDCPDDN